VLQWRQRQPTRAAVEWTINEVLNDLPQEPYPDAVWKSKVSATWDFFLNRGEQSGGAALN
jgi:type I restriction enzyme R subunit